MIFLKTKEKLKIDTSYKKIALYNRKPKKNPEKEKEKRKNKKKSNNNKYFFTFTFLYRKIYILLENTFGKT